MSSLQNKYRIRAYTDTGEAYIQDLKTNITRHFDATLLIEYEFGEWVEEEKVSLALATGQFLFPEKSDHPSWEYIRDFLVVKIKEATGKDEVMVTEQTQAQAKQILKELPISFLEECFKYVRRLHRRNCKDAHKSQIREMIELLRGSIKSDSSDDRPSKLARNIEDFLNSMEEEKKRINEMKPYASEPKEEAKVRGEPLAPFNQTHLFEQ